jgi:hypothetical protein
MTFRVKISIPAVIGQLPAQRPHWKQRLGSCPLISRTFAANGPLTVFEDTLKVMDHLA